MPRSFVLLFPWNLEYQSQPLSGTCWPRRPVSFALPIPLPPPLPGPSIISPAAKGPQLRRHDPSFHPWRVPLSPSHLPSPPWSSTSSTWKTKWHFSWEMASPTWLACIIMARDPLCMFPHKKRTLFSPSFFSCLHLFFSVSLCISQYKLHFAAVTHNSISVVLKPQSWTSHLFHSPWRVGPGSAQHSYYGAQSRRKRFLGVLGVLGISDVTPARNSLLRTIQRL